jgi:hypothetical protein
MTSAMNGVGHFSLLSLYPGEFSPAVNWMGHWMSPRSGVDGIEKLKSGNENISSERTHINSEECRLLRYYAVWLL